MPRSEISERREGASVVRRHRRHEIWRSEEFSGEGVATDLSTRRWCLRHFLLQNYPNAKIGILYQNDNSGKDYVKGLKDGLGAKSSMVIAEAAYETSDPTVDSRSSS